MPRDGSFMDNLGHVYGMYTAAFIGFVILGFPLGYYMGAQGSLIIFVWLIFNYAFKMNKADVDYGVEEEE